jgi:iron-sulfur cluster assembly protein
LGMALDEPRDADMTFTDQGVSFVIEKELYETAKPISVDFIEMPGESGFQVTSGLSSSCEGSCC